MDTHSLKSDLTILELGREHFPRFAKDTTEDQVREILAGLKKVVKKQRDLLVAKYQTEVGGNEEKIQEIQAAAKRILGL